MWVVQATKQNDEALNFTVYISTVVVISQFTYDNSKFPK